MGALKSDRCSKGHPMSGTNLYERKDGTRECRTCSRERARKQHPPSKSAKPKTDPVYDYKEES